MRKIKFLSLLLAMILVLMSLASCDMLGLGGSDDKDDDDDGKSGLESFAKKLEEGEKYYYQDVEIEVQFPHYSEYKDSMTQEQYENLKKSYEEEILAEMADEGKENLWYLKDENGNYTLQRDYLVFENGVITSYTECGYDWLEEEREGSRVYGSFAEEPIAYAIGTYEGDTYTCDLDNRRIYFSNGKVVVEDRDDVTFLIEYEIIYRYYYTPAN